jgi:hypothetical protein
MEPTDPTSAPDDAVALAQALACSAAERALWQQIQRDEATVKQSLTVRPEPPRLQIAAMFMQSIYARQYGTPCEFHALKRADALIEAAKEGK